MKRRSNCLFFTALTVMLLALILGCTQSDDVIAPVAATDISLTPARLFSPPDGYAYALWLIDENDSAIFIDVFDWDSELYRFKDTAGNRIDSVWTVEHDVLSPHFRYVAVTIEALDGPNALDTTDPGPVMLMDTIIDPTESPMKMVFPIDLWLGSLTFSVETPTDGNSQSNDAGGVWFALYVYDSLFIYDTTEIDHEPPGWPNTANVPGYYLDRFLDIDTTYWECLQGTPPNCTDSQEVTDADPYDWILVDTLNLDDYTNMLDTIGFLYDTLKVGTLLTSPVIQPTDTVWLDTLAYEYMTYEFVVTPVNITNQPRTDTAGYVGGAYPYYETMMVYPFRDYIYDIDYDVDRRTYMLDRFLSAHDELPDLTGSDWHYRGWVLSPELAPPYVAEGTFGQLQKPVWIKTAYNVYLRPLEGGIISTGSFKSFDFADDENPYSGVSRVPPFPGEDFLYNVPEGASNFCAGPLAAEGTILVTLEPDNFDNDASNFPMILFTGFTPANEFVNVSERHAQLFPMTNMYSAVENNPYGFPSIAVGIARR